MIIIIILIIMIIEIQTRNIKQKGICDVFVLKGTAKRKIIITIILHLQLVLLVTSRRYAMYRISLIVNKVAEGTWKKLSLYVDSVCAVFIIIIIIIIIRI